MKLSRTTNYNFGWLLLIGLVDVAFLLVFFLLLAGLVKNKLYPELWRVRTELTELAKQSD